MKKILQVNNTMNIGGIENFLKEVYSNIDHSKYQFYFLCYSDEKFDYEDEIKKNNGKFIKISNPKTISRKKHYKELLEVMKKYDFDAVHCHTYFDSGIVLYAALKSKIKIRIAHSHTTEGNNKVNIRRKLKWNLARLLIKISANYKLACSKEAGKSLFYHDDFIIIPNGIDIPKYEFNQETRKAYRKKYNISDRDIVIGHVGRFDPSKNHKFIIDLMKELSNKAKTYKLMLVGDGKNNTLIKEYVKKTNLEKQIIFVGSVLDASVYYNAFDIFVFPSLYEGLGISAIEAQINGLNIIASNNVPKEVDETSSIKYLPLVVKTWVNEIENIKIKRTNTKEYVKKSKFNISNTAKILEKIYSN